MSVIAPQTDVYLLKVPLEIDETNQLTFANATSQHNYFNSLPKVGYDKFTYQRKDGTIRVPALIDDILEYNYVMYRNTAYSNKWFYAFISGMEYINDQVTAVSIKTDVWQTWQFALDYKPVLIDREHTNNDAVGANTLPEGLELGEMVTNGSTVNFGPPGNYITVVDVSMLANPGENQTLTYVFTEGPEPDHPLTPPVNGIPSGTIHVLVGITGNSDPSKVIEVFDYAGLSDAIVNCYILPRTLIHSIGTYTGLKITARQPGASWDDPDKTKSVSGLQILVESSSQTDVGEFSFAVPSTINGYVPKNNKLKVFPFSYFNISNNAGMSVDYHYEDFSNGINFKIEGAFCPSGSVKAIPLNYKNIGTNGNAYDYSVTGAKYPICSWNSDSYTNWLTQNAVNMKMARETVVRQGIGSVLSGAVSGSAMGVGGAAVGALAGGASLVGNLLQNARDELQAKSNANLNADQVGGNINAGDVVWAKHRSQFTYIPMSIKAEYARCIDEFFSEFGYKCNRVKRPNITGRRNWNYVKTIGCYIDGDVPQADLQEIKSMFNKGVTFWHNPSTFGDYSQNNDII